MERMNAPALFDESMLTLLWESAGRPGILIAARQIAEAGVPRERMEAVLMAVAEQAFRSGGEVAGAAAFSLLKAEIPLDTHIGADQVLIEEVEIEGRKVQALTFSVAKVADEVHGRGKIMRLIQAIDDWRAKVWSESQAIDPDQAIDWTDMALGWIMAHGVRYQHDDDLIHECAVAMASDELAMVRLKNELLALEHEIAQQPPEAVKLVEEAPAAE